MGSANVCIRAFVSPCEPWSRHKYNLTILETRFWPAHMGNSRERKTQSEPKERCSCLPLSDNKTWQQKENAMDVTTAFEVATAKVLSLNILDVGLRSHIQEKLVNGDYVPVDENNRDVCPCCGADNGPFDPGGIHGWDAFGALRRNGECWSCGTV